MAIKRKILLSVTRAIKATLIYRELMDDQTSVLNHCQYISSLTYRFPATSNPKICLHYCLSHRDRQHSGTSSVCSGRQPKAQSISSSPAFKLILLNSRKVKTNYIHGVHCFQNASGARAKSPSKLKTSLGLVSEKTPRYHTVSAAA